MIVVHDSTYFAAAVAVVLNVHEVSVVHEVDEKDEMKGAKNLTLIVVTESLIAAAAVVVAVVVVALAVSTCYHLSVN